MLANRSNPSPRWRALTAALGLTGENRVLCRDWIVGGLSAATKRALEAEMNLKNYRFRTPQRRQFQAKLLAEGLAAGELAGEASGLAEAVFAVLDARGFTRSGAARERIVDCHDLAMLRRWVARAAVFRAADDLFDAPPGT